MEMLANADAEIKEVAAGYTEWTVKGTSKNSPFSGVVDLESG